MTIPTLNAHTDIHIDIVKYTEIMLTCTDNIYIECTYGYSHWYCQIHINNADMHWQYLHWMPHTDIHIDIFKYTEIMLAFTQMLETRQKKCWHALTMITLNNTCTDINIILMLDTNTHKLNIHTTFRAKSTPRVAV